MSATHLAVLVTAMALMAAAVPAAAPAHFGDVPADSAQKRKKPKKCKKGKVRVKVGKKSACAPLESVFPKPRAGDPRKLVPQAVLGTDLSKLRNRRGKRMPSLPKLIRQVGPGADKTLQKALARGLARLDALASSARAAQAGSGCGDSRTPRISDSVRSGDATVGVQLGPDGAQLGIELRGDEMSVKADVDLGLCDPNEVEAPSCPTAVGRLQGQIRYRLKVSIAVRRGDEEVWSQGVETVRRTKLTGWNEVDAKLDKLEVEDSETSTVSAGGSSRDFPPMSIRTRLVRRTEVNMRSGRYDAGNSQMDVSISVEGLYGPDRDDAEAQAERDGRRDADRQWRAVIDKAISGYKSREQGWQNPNACATARFNPTPNSLTLRAGASGSFTASAIAKEDGAASELDANLSEQRNATFSPGRAGGQSARFQYSGVVAQPPGAKVHVKVRATSKAGVAEGIWEQATRSDVVNVISGTFTGTHNADGAILTWAGNVVYRRVAPSEVGGANGLFELESGVVTVTASGRQYGCDQEGTKPFVLAGALTGQVDVHGTSPTGGAPYSYTISLIVPPPGAMDVVLTNCDGGNPPDGTVAQIGVTAPVISSQGAHVSPDGLSYDGEASQIFPPVSTLWSWSLRGEP